MRQQRDTLGELATFARRHFPPLDQDRAAERHQPVDGAQQRRLAGPVRSDQPQPLGMFDLQRRLAQDPLLAENDRDFAQLNGHCHNPTVRVVRSTTAKNGAPRNAVTTPIGSSEGDSSVRASTSVSTRKPPPASNDNGTTAR